MEGVTFTTRGCNKKCPWCLVPKREGRLAEIQDFPEGYIIQDNNLIQSGRDHMLKVFAMLDRQKRAAVFSGGIDATLVGLRLGSGRLWVWWATRAWLHLGYWRCSNSSLLGPDEGSVINELEQ